MIDTVVEITIDRAVDAVAQFACDPDNAPAWYVNIKSVAWKTPPPLVVGSRIAFVAEFLGRVLSYTYEIIEFEPGRRLAMRTAEGPFPMETAYEFASKGEQTLMRLRNRGTPAGFSKLFSPLMAFAVRRANRADLFQLKALMER